MKSQVVGVDRVDRGSTHGWQARIMRRGEAHSRFFSDAVYGGKRAAYHEAVAWRESMHRKLPAPLPSGRAVA